MEIGGKNNALQAFLFFAFLTMLLTPSQGFTTAKGTTSSRTITKASTLRPATVLKNQMDPVTYLRTEWISAALVTNQTPRSADVCLQLGTQDGRAVSFLPRTIRELITSTVEADGELDISTRRQLTQQQERRTGSAKVMYVNQRADDLKEIADESVDVVISLQAAAKMQENGLDWKKSIDEAARVLKAGGRFLFVEQTTLDGESYLEVVADAKVPGPEGAANDAEKNELFPAFEPVGYDDVDLVLTPHVAGVVIKSENAGMTPEDIARKEMKAEKERIADLSISAYERGIKKRKRKKKKSTTSAETAES